MSGQKAYCDNCGTIRYVNQVVDGDDIVLICIVCESEALRHPIKQDDFITRSRTETHKDN